MPPKKSYHNPTITIVLLDCHDLVCTSGPTATAPDIPWSSHERTGIWDE